MVRVKEIYVLADGEKVLAGSPEELLEHMRSGSFDETKDLADYMFKFSERCLLSMHVVVRIDTPEHFVEDLKRHGMIQDVLQAN